MPFSEEEIERYSRQIVLEEIGYGGQKKLREGRVCITEFVERGTTNGGDYWQN